MGGKYVRTGNGCEPECTCSRHYMRGRSCEPGCKCGRHKRERMKRPNCIAVESDGTTCAQPHASREHKLCRKHLQRFLRHGGFDKKRGNRFTKDNKEASVAGKKGKKAQYEKRQYIRKAEPDVPCICGQLAEQHALDHHSGTPRHCKVFGCMCRQFTPADRTFWQQQMDKLRQAGISEVINKQGRCDYCGQQVQIGRWFDPEAVRRALVHTRRSCSKRPKVVVRPSFATSPNRAAGVR